LLRIQTLKKIHLCLRLMLRATQLRGETTAILACVSRGTLVLPCAPSRTTQAIDLAEIALLGFVYWLLGKLNA
jgi:hypothetical protein